MTPRSISRLLSLILLALVLSACAGQILPERRASASGENTIRVESDPPDAEVWVMDRSWGRAPVDIPLKEVFPVVYSPLKYDLLGKVKLVREGCEPLTLAVGSRGAGAQLTGKLHCVEPLPPTAPVAVAPKPATTTAAPVPAAEEAQDARERLLRLERLREDGLISDEEYQEVRRRVLDTL